MTSTETNMIADARWEHQPLPQLPARPAPSRSELQKNCGKTAALILATECDTTPLRVMFDDEKEPFTCADDNTARPLQLYEGAPLIQHAVKLAHESELASISVLVGGTPSVRKQIESVIEEAEKRTAEGAALNDTEPNDFKPHDAAENDTAPSGIAANDAAENGVTANDSAANIRILPYDREHDRTSTANACGFALFDYTVDVLEAARECLTSTPGADSVLLLACDEVRITPAHVFEVCRAFREDPALDVATSWITWESREPALISRAFLEGYATSSLVRTMPGGLDRPIPSIHAHQVVFGEEKLAANAVVPAQVENFFKERTLSAREAVRIAREELGEANVPPDATAATDAPSKADSPSDAPTDMPSGVTVKSNAQAASQDAINKPKRSSADQLLVDIAGEILETLESEAAPEILAELDWANTWARRNRLDFPVLNDHAHKNTLAYLDSAATSQRVLCALQAQSNFDTHENANVYRGSYELSAQATFTLNDARKTLEDFIGSKRRHTVYTANTSASCNLVAQAWGERNISEGDLIVVALTEHHSNFLPWQMLAKKKKAQLEVIPLLPNGKLNLAAYEKLLARKPKIICVAHISNVLGIENPVRDMTAAAHEAGARFLLDAAQSFAHLPLDVDELKADFVAFSAHKAYGPMGIGGLWISDEAFDEMDPVSIGGGSISHASLDSYYLRVGAIQYEVGTPPVSQAIGWSSAIEYLQELGMNSIARHAGALTRYLTSGLHHIENTTVWADHTATDGQSGLVSFSVAGVSSLDLGAFCGKLGVAIRSGSHCALPLVTSMGVKGTGRASLAVHTTKEDVEALLVAVSACERLYWNRA